MKFVESKEWSDYEAIVGVLTPTLGNHLSASMRAWCGLENRPYPLAEWRVWLVFAAEEVVALTGLYRAQGDQADEGWIGWFGIKPAVRGQGFGAAVLARTEDAAMQMGYRLLRVHTEPGDRGASAFYRQQGYTLTTISGGKLGQRSASSESLILQKELRSRL